MLYEEQPFPQIHLSLKIKQHAYTNNAYIQIDKMSLSSEPKKHLYESLQQQCLNQKSAKYNKAKRPKGAMDQRSETLSLLKDHDHTDKNDTTLLDAYRPEEISDEYIIWMAEQGFIVVDHLSEVYRLPNAYECIDGNLPLHLVLNIDARQKLNPMNPELSFLDERKISHEDLLSRILIAYANIVYSNLKHLITLNAFVLASSSNANKCSWHIVYNYICFVNYRDLRGFVKKVTDRVGKPYSEFIDIGLYKSQFSLWLLGSAKKDRLQIGRIKKRFINFQAQSIKECLICDVKHEKDQLYGFIHQNKHFILKCYHQKQYKPEHKGLSFDKALSTPHQFPKLSKKSINVKEMKDALDAFSDFLSEEPSTTLIRSIVGTRKTKTLRKILASLAQSDANLPCTIWVSYCKTLSNKFEAKLKELEKFDFKVGQYQNIVADLKTYKWDLIIVQVESILHLDFQESHFSTHVVTIDAFANDLTLAFLKSYQGENIQVIDNKYQLCKGEIVKFLYDPDKGLEAIHKGFRMLQEGKHVAFVMTSCKKARALANQASKLQKLDDDFTNVDAIWSTLDCVIYTSTVEAGISFEISNYFDTVIRITNNATLVHVEAFAQMDKIANCYAFNLSPAVETYIEVEYQRHLSAKYFPEIFCSLIASTGVTLELILMEDTEKVNRKKISYTIKNIEKKIKDADAESIANAPNISSSEAEILKQNIIHSFANNMTLQQHYFDIDDMNILSSDDVTKVFKQSQKKIVKIQEDALLLFSFKTRAKGLPNLNATIKFINAVMKSIDKTQELFDSIPITTDITILEVSNEICKQSSCNNIVKKSETNLLQLPSLASTQNLSNVSKQFSDIIKTKKELSKFLISLSSEFLIRNESDIDSFILLLQQKFQILKEKLEQ
ncbi:8640_t:CDS:10 [Cetraspora pellucida]|uniref:8640_t:CDS:1 n=1 Tax=Cetraspora pellucida TaxID=1433469 RepID=A0ACA9KDY3_9GLOM|nr:8640_t:CDS:10 [Cetraspora pellucida]